MLDLPQPSNAAGRPIPCGRARHIHGYPCTACSPSSGAAIAPLRTRHRRRVWIVTALLGLFAFELLRGKSATAGQENLPPLANLKLPGSASRKNSHELEIGDFKGYGAGSHGDHGADGLSHDMGVLIASPRVFIAEVATVIFLSSIFEWGEHRVRHRFAHRGGGVGIAILDSLSREFTTLGFIGFFVYISIRAGVADALASSFLGNIDGHVLAETFETVHMMIFGLMLVLMTQAAAMLHTTTTTVAVWGYYERTRAHGLPKSSLESMLVEAGYLERAVNPEAPDVPLLTKKKAFKTGSTMFARFKARQDPLHQLISWRAIRHEFLFPKAKQSEPRVPNPALFTFEGYLRRRLAKILLELVELDMGIWIVTLVASLPLFFAGLYLPILGGEVVQAVIAWVVLAASGVLATMLGEDLDAISPRIPEDPRKILDVFEGTSAQMLMRGAGVAIESASRKVLRKASTRSLEGTWLSLYRYGQFFRFLAFWQAISVTALGVTCATKPANTRMDVLVRCIAFAEWPFMLLWVVPGLVRRITILSSIHFNVDEEIVRSVSLSVKEGLLRFMARLVRMDGLYRRGLESREAWALHTGDESWKPADALEAVKTGERMFATMSAFTQKEIWDMFVAFDKSGDEQICSKEIHEIFVVMGLPESADEIVRALVRHVDTRGTQELTWREFRALVALAIADTDLDELEEDLDKFFDLIDTDGDDSATVMDISTWVRKIRGFVTDDDVASLLYGHFLRPKPAVTREEFMEWLIALLLKEGPGDSRSHEVTLD